MLPSGWIRTTIGEQVTLQRGFDITKAAAQRSGSVPVISSGGVSCYHDTAAALRPGVVIGRKGVVGSVYYVPEDYWPHDTTLRVRDFKGNHQRFVYYVFRKMATRLAGMDVGSANPTLNRNHVHPIEIVWPPSPTEQEAIAKTLGALDDKIEHNRRTARALERLARAVFRAWFVDFEPVKAKAAGAISFPSMPQPVFEALPTRFVDSEIGPVLEGWRVKPIGDVVSVKGGATPNTKNPEYWEEGIHCWATPRDMSRLPHPVLLDTERRITDAGIDCISSGLLPPGTVLMSSQAPVGYLAVAGVPTAVNQGFIAMVCDGPLPPTYVWQWAHASMDAIHGRANGTTFAGISKKNFRPLPVVVPPPTIVTAFRNLADPHFDLLMATVKRMHRWV